MAALIFSAGIAVAIAKESGDRFGGAWGKCIAQDIDAWIRLHGVILQAFQNIAEHFHVALANAWLPGQFVGLGGGLVKTG